MPAWFQQLQSCFLRTLFLSSSFPLFLSYRLHLTGSQPIIIGVWLLLCVVALQLSRKGKAHRRVCIVLPAPRLPSPTPSVSPEDLNLPAVNCLCCCLFGDVFISSFLSSFDGYGILSVRVFSFNTLNVLYHCFLGSRVPSEKAADSLSEKEASTYQVGFSSAFKMRCLHHPAVNYSLSSQGLTVHVLLGLCWASCL